MSRQDVVNRLEKVLRGESFAKELSECLAGERETSYSDFSLSERLDHDQRIIVCEDKLADLLDEHVFCWLPRPHAITPTDLKQVLFAQFGGVPGDRFVAAHERFVEHLLLRIPVDGHEGERFDLGYWNKDVDSLDSEFPWKAPDGTFDFYVQFYSQAGTPDRDLQVYGTLWGYASTAAMEQAGREFRRLVPSIIQSLSLVYSRFPLSNDVFSRFFHPPCSLLKGGWGNRFFSECVSRYFGARDNEMHRRMGNAVRLLVQADDQEDKGIGLSLCFSAIEAIVCEGTRNITKQLSTNVPALLQPDRTKRETPEKRLKEVYNIRCRVLHGGAIDDAPRDTARLLAAAVLAAAIEWNAFQHRVGNTSARKTFLEELHDAASGRPMIGVPDNFSRCLELLGS